MPVANAGGVWQGVGMEELKAGSELDALIAEKVMGLEIVGRIGERRVYRGTDEPPLAVVPLYSTEIAAAWLVVEKMQGSHWMFSVNCGEGGWWCVAYPTAGQCTIETEYTETAPLAICRAALMAAAAKQPASD